MTWCRWSSQIVQWSSFCGPQSLRPSGGSQYPLLSAAERSQWWPCRSVSTSFNRWRFSNFKAKICFFFLFLIRVYDQKYLSFLKVDLMCNLIVEHTASLIGCVKNVNVYRPGHSGIWNIEDVCGHEKCNSRLWSTCS